jgi:hypothetical protein
MAPPLVGGSLAALELLWSRADLLLAALIGSGSLSRAGPSFSNTTWEPLDGPSKQMMKTQHIKEHTIQSTYHSYIWYATKENKWESKKERKKKNKRK